MLITTRFGQDIKPAMYVDISTTMPVKEEMLAAHASQRNWLLEHHGIDEYILDMKHFGEKRGGEAGVQYAEGFRQHLGHGFRQKNVLAEALEEYTVIK